MPQWALTVLCLVALVVAGFALLRANRVQAANRTAVAHLMTGATDTGADTAGKAVGAIAAGDGGARIDPQALRRVAVVRYDAFPDVGGRLSFSVALLTEAGDGLVLSAIHSRSDTRSYVKKVTAGAGESALSPEELTAVAEATAARPGRSPSKDAS